MADRSASSSRMPRHCCLQASAVDHSANTSCCAVMDAAVSADLLSLLNAGSDFGASLIDTPKGPEFGGSFPGISWEPLAWTPKLYHARNPILLL